MKYIDADLLGAEIAFAKSVYSSPNRVICGVADAFRQDGRAAMCDDILKKIDSLRHEHPDFADASKMEQPSLPSNLDEAAVLSANGAVISRQSSIDGRVVYNLNEKCFNHEDLVRQFKAGAKWQREQIMKDAVEGIAEELYNDGEPQCTIGVGTYFMPGQEVYVIEKEEK